MGAQQKNADRYFSKNVQSLHQPTTNILDRIKEALKSKGMLRKISITPAMATDIMTLNVNNRPVKNDTVFEYEGQMVEGKWQYTSQSIIVIDSEGHLIDAQQRLLAQIKAGVTLVWDISTGYDRETFKVLDKGRNRTAGDTFALEGIGDHNKAAHAATFIIGLMIQGRVTLGMRSKGINDTMLIEWVRDEKNKKRLIECIETGDELFKHSRMLSHTLYAGMLFILGSYRKADAEEFMTRLANGEDISQTKDSAIYHLRNNVLLKWKEKHQGKGFGNRRTNEMKVRWIITAWNYYVQKDSKGRSIQITSLKLDKDEEGIPKIRRS